MLPKDDDVEEEASEAPNLHKCSLHCTMRGCGLEGNLNWIFGLKERKPFLFSAQKKECFGVEC